MAAKSRAHAACRALRGATYGIIPAPYMAKHHWVLVQDPKALNGCGA